jgi:hypothetical protein
MAKNNQQSLSDVIAVALIKAGVKVVTNVPGSGGNEVFAAYRKISGKSRRSHSMKRWPIHWPTELLWWEPDLPLLFKSHGLVKAGNSIIDSLCAGTTAGLLIIVFNDNSEHIRTASWISGPTWKGPGCHRDDKPGQPAGQIIRLFQESEKRRLPYALLVEAEDTRRILEADEEPISGTPSPEYQRNITQHVLCPFFVGYQYRVLKAKYANEDWTSIAQPAIPRIP